MQSGVFTMTAQERVVYATAAEQAIVTEADHFAAKRVFITSTRSLAALRDGPLQRIESSLGKRLVGRFATISSHSPREDVIAAANAARTASADLIVAVGGGSVTDASKVVQLCLWHDITSVDELNHYAVGFNPQQPSPIDYPADGIRMVSVPTTLSAADFTSLAGITDTSTRNKLAFKHRMLVPASVVLDPAATLHTPDWLLYSTGIRSVDHAVESYCCPAANPATESLSLRGLALLSQGLPAIQADPASAEARSTAQFGMWHAIWPTTAGVYHGASHGIGYALGAGYGVPHGHTSCVLLPAVMQWNASVNADRQRALATAMGEPDVPAWQSVAELIAGLGMPRRLRDVGIAHADLQDIARRALTYQPVLLNPRPVKTQHDVMQILELCY